MSVARVCWNLGFKKIYVPNKRLWHRQREAAKNDVGLEYSQGCREDVVSTIVHKSTLNLENRIRQRLGSSHGEQRLLTQ